MSQIAFTSNVSVICNRSAFTSGEKSLTRASKRVCLEACRKFRNFTFALSHPISIVQIIGLGEKHFKTYLFYLLFSIYFTASSYVLVVRRYVTEIKSTGLVAFQALYRPYHAQLRGGFLFPKPPLRWNLLQQLFIFFFPNGYCTFLTHNTRHDTR